MSFKYKGVNSKRTGKYNYIAAISKKGGSGIKGDFRTNIITRIKVISK